MNADKAKEFFSAYHEGTLDRGLRESFERRLSADPEVQAEYNAFARTMQALQGLAAPVPEPDFDLGERIAARLDRYIHETKPKPSAVFFGRWRTVFAAGVCFLLIAGAATQLGPGGVLHIFGSGLLTREAPIPDHLSVLLRDGVPTLGFRTWGDKTVEIRDAETGRILRAESVNGSHTAAGATIRSPLRYASTDPKLLEIQTVDSPVKTYVALPGSATVLAASGHGTLRDLALALADRYHLVVVLTARGDQAAAWDLKDDAVASATESLKGTSRTVEQRTEGVLWIQ